VEENSDIAQMNSVELPFSLVTCGTLGVKERLTNPRESLEVDGGGRWNLKFNEM